MQPQKPNTNRSFGNCNVEYGIEGAITGRFNVAVGIVKRLKSEAESHDFEGSADQFFVDCLIGYKDAGNVGYERDMQMLPAICGNCRSQRKCYATTDKGFRKREPQ